MRNIAAHLLALALVTISARAQTDFAGEQVLFVNNQPLAAFAGNLNADTDPDLVMADAALSAGEIVTQILDCPYTRVPLYADDPDNGSTSHARALAAASRAIVARGLPPT